MKNKILKIIGIIVLVIIGLLIAIPFFLEAKMGDIIKKNVNSSINGTFDFADADLSLISSFPNAEVSMTDLYIINAAPFEGDTLFTSKKVAIKMGIMQLFKSSEEAIKIESLSIDNAHLHIKIDEEENANYDIAKETELAEESGANFTLDLESYVINDSRIWYDDLAGGIHLEVLDINHKGTGDLSLNKSELQTTTDALVSFEMDSTNYLNKNKVKLDALIGIDLDENKYTFLKNNALVNQLPLVFDGYVKVLEDHQEVAISFKTPSSDFKNFLGVIPEAYSKNIENVKTTGNFVVEGQFKGIVDEAHIPEFNININSENASFKYPELPKSVRNVYIDTEINNTTGIAEDTYVIIDKLSFMIDEDTFNMTAKITELLGNTKVNAHVKGNMNLANIEKAYPVPTDLDLKGLLNLDVTTAFDMASIEKKQYANTKTSGLLNVRNFEYKSPEIANPVQINIINMDFNPQTVNLKKLEGKTGTTDFSATGTINNLLGFMFNDENVEGKFNLSSNTFALNDFMVAEQEVKENLSVSKQVQASSNSEEKIMIPSFLDATINVSANTVLYDNITLNNVKGTLRIRDETAILSNMTSDIFDGKMAFNGQVSTKNEVPVFGMKLGMNQLQIGETFKALELFEVLAPIAKILKGTLNSDIELTGNLTNDFTPDLLTLSGNVLAELLTTNIGQENAPLLAALEDKLNFIHLEDLNLKGLKTALSFENGLVRVKPFTISYKDIDINVNGGHSFDKNLEYSATLQVPAKYLGKEINSLISKIDEKELENLTIPVIANIGGVYTNPKVTTDLTSGIKNLTSQLIEIQKQKLLNQGKDKAKDLIGGIFTDNKRKTDSLNKKDSTRVGVRDVLGGVLNNTKKKQDSTKAIDSSATKKDPVQESAKDILGGLFGKKKKDTSSVRKDSVN